MYRRVLTSHRCAHGPAAPGGTWECSRSGRAQGPLLGGLLNRRSPVQADAVRAHPQTLRWRDPVLGGARHLASRRSGTGCTCSGWHKASSTGSREWLGRDADPRPAHRRAASRRAARGRSLRPRRSGHPGARQRRHRPQPAQCPDAPRRARRGGRRRPDASRSCRSRPSSGEGARDNAFPRTEGRCGGGHQGVVRMTSCWVARVIAT